MAGSHVIKAFGLEKQFLANYIKMQDQRTLNNVVNESCQKWNTFTMNYVKMALTYFGMLLCITKKG